MKLIGLIVLLLMGFAVKLLSVPAAPFLITFAQPDGSTFQAHLKGDEYFSWIETENKMILVKIYGNITLCSTKSSFMVLKLIF